MEQIDLTFSSVHAAFGTLNKEGFRLKYEGETLFIVDLGSL